MGDRLINGYLEVELADPYERIGARFDRTGFMTSVRLLDGGHTFCAPESVESGSGTGGFGLCNEFGIFSPVGYDDAAAGETFPKIGVGLLTRTDGGKYDFSRPYPVKEFPLDVFRNEREIRYVMHPLPCRGYALRLEKTVRLQDASILVEYALHNVGTRRIRTQEYAHNFLSVDGHPVGPDYRLLFGSPASLESMEPDFTPELLNVRAKEVRWRAVPHRPFYCTFKPNPDPGSFYWELVHGPTGAAVRESGDFEAERIALWGMSHVVSPEVFLPVDIGPGEFQFWSRKYDFSVTKVVS